MAVLRRLDAAAVRRWCAAALAELRARRQEIDDINVYPVPDGDAGTNMVAALAVHDPARGLADDVIAMTSAAAATRCGYVTVATHEAQTGSGNARPGEVLGLVKGDVVAIGTDVADVAVGVLDRMLAAAGELVTVVAGVGVTDAKLDALTASLRMSHPVVRVDTHRGEQAADALLIGVE